MIIVLCAPADPTNHSPCARRRRRWRARKSIIIQLNKITLLLCIPPPPPPPCTLWWFSMLFVVIIGLIRYYILLNATMDRSSSKLINITTIKPIKLNGWPWRDPINAMIEYRYNSRCIFFWYSESSVLFLSLSKSAACPLNPRQLIVSCVFGTLNAVRVGRPMPRTLSEGDDHNNTRCTSIWYDAFNTKLRGN